MPTELQIALDRRTELRYPRRKMIGSVIDSGCYFGLMRSDPEEDDGYILYLLQDLESISLSDLLAVNDRRYAMPFPASCQAYCWNFSHNDLVWNGGNEYSYLGNGIRIALNLQFMDSQTDEGRPESDPDVLRILDALIRLINGICTTVELSEL